MSKKISGLPEQTGETRFESAPPNRLVRTVEAAVYCGPSQNTFAKLLALSSGSVFHKVRRRVHFAVSGLDKWLEAARHRSRLQLVQETA